jgi:glutathione S-transferase
MGKPVVYGADYSVYVRIVRLTLEEKGIDYDVVPVDVFAADGIPSWYFDHHPFGRIPAFEHDGFRLYETGAIARYVDEAFDGPALQPVEVRPRARMNQIIGMLDAYAYRAMVWDVAVERLEKEAPDETLIANGLRQASTTLQALTSLKAPGPCCWETSRRSPTCTLPRSSAISSRWPRGKSCWPNSPTFRLGGLASSSVLPSPTG